ncbi:MAG: hypothetical protein QOF76_3855 [Solirubrobacteraceae bacterium]|nr:hypothetical protein [Solirubrobacteraceae bacterium]
MRLPFVIIAVLACLLVPLALRSSDDTAGAGRPATPIATIARRVEAVRHLRYETIPKPLDVSPATATKEGLADLDRDYPAAARHGDEALYTLLGLLPPKADLRTISGSIFGEQVAGYYDPSDGRLRIVKGGAVSDPILGEITIAHELDHALEDQAIGIDTKRASAGGDGALAYTALVEGTATAVMFTYLERFFKREDALGAVFGSAFSGGSTAGIPPFTLAGLLFPYTAGRNFVANLYKRAGNGWRLIDEAERTRPPVSTEQILHPEKWVAREAPERVTLPGPPAGFHTLTKGTFGEFQTGQLVANTGAATGWGGDGYAVYRRGDGPCDTPCRSRDVLIMRWRWDTPDAQHNFQAALRDYADGLRVPGKHVIEGPDGVTLVLAPTAAQAGAFGA